MAEVNQAEAAGGSFFGFSFVRFCEYDLIEYPRPANHQQAHIADDIIREGFVGYIIAVDVQSEILPLDAAAVCEFDLEVKFYPLFHCRLPIYR